MIGNTNKVLIVIVITALVVGGTYFFAGSSAKKQKVSKVIATNYVTGLTSKCRPIPKFISSLNMRAPSLDSRQNDGDMGLLIRDTAVNNKFWQHESWAQSGYIGAFDRDNRGNVYVSPLPYVSLKKNPPEKQNQVYIIDAKTAEMSLFMKLPAENPPNPKNPFGAMGMFYDCDTQSLYVSSLAGSKPMQEKGVIYQIDVNSKKIISTLENTDAIGVGVLNTSKGKILYFGSARSSHLYSIKLDNKGRFVGEKQYELSLSQVKGGNSTVVKKVQFKEKNKRFYMILKEVEFGFRLLAENNPFKKKYNFMLDETSNKWVFQGISKD